jgi:MYXO-CTERM domain-containing protein
LGRQQPRRDREVCDEADNDCANGADFAGETTDEDTDGSVTCLDCDDADPDNFLGNTEVCDGADNDCDGLVPQDEEDGDEDGSPACADCDDDDNRASPDFEEECGDGIDNNCNGTIDEDCGDDDDSGDGGDDGCQCFTSVAAADAPSSLALLLLLGLTTLRRRRSQRPRDQLRHRRPPAADSPPFDRGIGLRGPQG